MKITFESEKSLPTFNKVISVLTDKAKICVDDIHHDEVRGIVNIAMQRKDIVDFKKSFLGEMRPIYGHRMNKSLLTIKNVKEMKVVVADQLITDCNSCFTVLFGLKVDDNRLYLGSAEEEQGNLLCEISIEVKELSIEFGDDVKQ
jgi:hypothetical protein